MTDGQPAALRAEAKALRKRARELDQEAERMEHSAEQARRVAASREALEARAAAFCRPVWRPGKERAGGPWILFAVQGGRFHVALPPREGTVPGPQADTYVIGTGYPAGWEPLAENRRRLGELDSSATLTAWREWCAARKAREDDAYR